MLYLGFFCIVLFRCLRFTEGFFVLAATRITILLLAMLKNWYHVIILLILIELIILIVFIVVLGSTERENRIPLMFIFTTFIVIEASVGIAVLTTVARSHGNDFMVVF